MQTHEPHKIKTVRHMSFPSREERKKHLSRAYFNVWRLTPDQVSFDALGERSYRAKVTEIGVASANTSSAFPVTVSLLEECDQFRAGMAADVNERTENIGARRLHTILEKVLEDLSFTAPDRSDNKFVVTADYVKEQLSEISKDEDLSRYIL